MRGLLQFSRCLLLRFVALHWISGFKLFIKFGEFLVIISPFPFCPLATLVTLMFGCLKWSDSSLMFCSFLCLFSVTSDSVYCSLSSQFFSACMNFFLNCHAQAGVRRGVRAPGSYQEGTGKSGSYGMWNHPRGHVWNVFVRPASS